MDIYDIITIFTICETSELRTALKNAVKREKEITPHLVKAVEYFCDYYDKITEENMLCFFSVVLLSQFHCQDAHEAICRLAKIPYDYKKDYLQQFLGDLMENFARIIANTYNGDTRHILSVIECVDAEPYVRDCAMESLVILAIKNIIPRETVISIFRSFLINGLETNPLESDDILLINGMIIGCCYDLSAVELLPLIKKKFDDGLVDSTYVGYEEEMAPIEPWIERNINCTDDAIKICERFPYMFPR